MSRARRKKLGRTGSRAHHRRSKLNLAVYHLRPRLELLETRLLLTTVTGVDPLPGTHSAPVTADISAVYDTDINPATVSAESFAVHGAQTGQILESLSVSDDTITLSPAAPLHPGEVVQVTATRGIEDLDGEPAATPFVWQFRTAATGGTGLFTDSGQRLGDSNSRVVALGDVDGDGDLDAFVGNVGYREPNTVWLNDGSGTFTDSGQRLVGPDTLAVALGDVDGDGDLDAFVGSRSHQGDPVPNTVWLNDGSGTFTDSGQILGDSISRAVALGDVDGDGDLDAFVGNGNFLTGHANKVWLNDGSGTFTDSGQILGDSYSLAMALGDVDGDGDLDAFVGNLRRTPNKVWLNDGSGTFTDSGQILGDSGIFAVALGDVDGDGDLDAFVGNPGGYPNKVWLNDGSGTFTDSGQTLGDLESYAVALGDVDGDGDLDVVADRVWLNQDPPPGDFDFDLDVDGDDFLAWQVGFGIQMGAKRSDGDADRDGDVDEDDFLLWHSNFGVAVAAQGSGATAPDHQVHLEPRADGAPLRTPRRIHAAAVDRSLSDDVLLDQTHKTKLKASILGDDLLTELARRRAARKDALGA